MLNKVPVFHFQNLSDLIDCNLLLGYNRIYGWISIGCGDIDFKNYNES